MNIYQKSIIEDSGCTESEVEEVEDIMRNTIVHSTLDWLSAAQFKKAAKEAYDVYKFMNSEEGKQYIANLEAQMEVKYGGQK